MQSKRVAVLLGDQTHRQRTVMFLTPEEMREASCSRVSPPVSMQEIIDLARVERRRWKEGFSQLRIAGVMTAAQQYFTTTMIGPNVMQADQTTLTGTTKGLITPVGPWNTFAANTVQPNTVMRLHVGGIMTTPASAATTFIIDPIWGATSGDLSLGVGQTSGTVAASQTNACWNTFAVATVRQTAPDVQTTRPTVLKGSFHCPRVFTAAPIGTINYGLESATAINIDTSASKSLLLAATLGGSASFTMAAQILSLETMS